MNVELWEKKRQSSLKEKIFYRQMPGYLMYATSRDSAEYYPEPLVTLINKQLPHVKIDDLLYKLDRTRKSVHHYERLRVKVFVKHLFIDLVLCFRITEKGCELDLRCFVDETPETTKETEEIIHLLYQQMKQFLEENSPSRLLLLSTPVTELLPSWLK